MSDKMISIKIAIDIPADIAAETLNKIQPTLNQLGSGVVTPIEPVKQEYPSLLPEGVTEADVQEKYENNKRQFARNAVQAYRTYRRIVGDYEKPSQAYRQIAARYDWPTSIMPSVIGDRKRAIKAYIKLRHKRRVWQLAQDGNSNQQIANALNLSIRTVQRLLKEVREQVRSSVLGAKNA